MYEMRAYIKTQGLKSLWPIRPQDESYIDQPYPITAVLFPHPALSSALSNRHVCRHAHLSPVLNDQRAIVNKCYVRTYT